ncbi:MAG: LytTR family transcriptional regulator DNA-binding domain-containing protein [Lachnospiraceae bacterium]|nr:LytTR family transcriptional regulator DNA-binding domain-containing protein [Lachnospiraceae bacterium]
MKINVYQEPDLKENHVDLYYNQMDEETTAIKQYLSAFEGMITGKDEETERERMLKLGEILYIEVVDRKTYAYLKDSIWRISYGLQQFMDKFGSVGFARNNKSMLVNIYHIQELKAQVNMRVNILMDNGEQIVLNRSYKNEFYKYLEKKVTEELK